MFYLFITYFTYIIYYLYNLFFYLFLRNKYIIYMSNFLYLVAEIWMWLGVLRLYEHRNFSTH